MANWMNMGLFHVVTDMDTDMCTHTLPYSIKRSEGLRTPSAYRAMGPVLLRTWRQTGTQMSPWAPREVGDGRARLWPTLTGPVHLSPEGLMPLKKGLFSLLPLLAHSHSCSPQTSWVTAHSPHLAPCSLRNWAPPHSSLLLLLCGSNLLLAIPRAVLLAVAGFTLALQTKHTQRMPFSKQPLSAHCPVPCSQFLWQ